MQHLLTYRRGGEKRKDGSDAPWQPVKNPKRAWKTACKAVGVRYRFHDTKASFVTTVAHVAPAAVTQQLARHKSYETTRRYLRVADKAARQAVEDATIRIRQEAVNGAPASSPTQESRTGAETDAPNASHTAKEKALDPLRPKAFSPFPELVGATGFEPATPRPPVQHR